jgi:hypothetical protein
MDTGVESSGPEADEDVRVRHEARRGDAVDLGGLHPAQET